MTEWPQKIGIHEGSPEETKSLLKFYIANEVPYAFTRGPLKQIYIFLNNQDAIIANPDCTTTWKAREVLVEGHAFIELVTGEGDKQKTVFVPFCFVNPKTRTFAWDIIKETLVGRQLGAKNAVFFIATLRISIEQAQAQGFAINLLDIKTGLEADIPINAMTALYMLVSKMPQKEVVDKYFDPDCPACQEYIVILNSKRKVSKNES